MACFIRTSIDTEICAICIRTSIFFGCHRGHQTLGVFEMVRAFGSKSTGHRIFLELEHLVPFTERNQANSSERPDAQMKPQARAISPIRAENPHRRDSVAKRSEFELPVPTN
jgi:hypothetical protein